VRRRALVVSLGAVAVGAVAVALAGRGGAGSPHPVPPPEGASRESRDALLRVAEGAGGRRVLYVRGKRGTARSARILESGRAPEGWAVYDAAPPGAGDLAAVLGALASRAAAEWDAASGLPSATVRALEVFDVKTILVDATDGFEVPSRLPSDGSLAAAPGVPALRVTRAEPVRRLTGVLPPTTDPVEFARSLAAEPAAIGDDEDRLWGGSMTVDAPTPGRYLFAWPAGAPVVEVDGRPVEPVAGTPFLVLDLPAGRSRVDVRRVVAEPRGWVVVGGLLALVAGLFGAIASFRPSRDEIEAAAARQEEAAAAGGR
jgi:hypothetical protein